MRLKQSIFLGVTSLFLFSFGAYARGIEKAPIETAFIHQESGEVSLEIEGYLPDSCYSPVRAETSNGKGLTVVDIVSKVEGEICAEIVTLFKLSVPLGSFPMGRHSVLLQEGSRWEREIFFEVGSTEIQEL